MGFHCSECMFATVSYRKETKSYQAACSRGYTLTNPKVHTSPEDHFAEDPTMLVPTVDPFGHEYLRTSNVCKSFLRLEDLPQTR